MLYKLVTKKKLLRKHCSRQMWRSFMNWLIMTNSTEHVDARNPGKVDVHVQTDDESFKNTFF